MSAPVWKGTTELFHQIESGGLTLGGRVLLVDVYRGTYANALAGILMRGTYGTGAREGWVVTESVLDREKGAIGRLTIRWEPGGPDGDPAFLPNDEFDVSVSDLQPKIERHPMFKDDLDAETIGWCYSAVFGATPDQRTIFSNKINAITDPDKKALALVLKDKYSKGQEHYYLVAIKYVWIWHAWTVPELSLGGFIDTPGGPLAGVLPAWDYLRQADIIKPKGVNGSVYEVQSSWIGGPTGFWDMDVYPPP